MSVIARIEAALETTVDGEHTLGGGCINRASRIDTADGPRFLKWNATPSAMFSTEAAGLTALKNSGTSLVIPTVLAYEDPTPNKPGFLVTDYLEPGRREKNFDEALGHGLAELHRATRATFGFEMDTYCGATIQPNPDIPRWVDFYRDQRLGHQLRISKHLYSKNDVRAFESLFSRLDDLLADDEPPALIHGDLWSGNLHADGPRPALIDPAVYYAHREAELGMMTLFGGFSARVYAAYEDVWPLRAGWRERNPLYELYHVMNHATLFGGGYVSQAAAIARRYSNA